MNAYQTNQDRRFPYLSIEKQRRRKHQVHGPCQHGMGATVSTCQNGQWGPLIMFIHFPQTCFVCQALPTPFIIFSVMCVIVSLTTLRHMLGYTNDQPTSSLVSPRDTCHLGASTNTLAWVCSIELWGVCLCYTVVYKLTKLYTNDIWHSYVQ